MTRDKETFVFSYTVAKLRYGCDLIPQFDRSPCESFALASPPLSFTWSGKPSPISNPTAAALVRHPCTIRPLFCPSISILICAFTTPSLPPCRSSALLIFSTAPSPCALSPALFPYRISCFSISTSSVFDWSAAQTPSNCPLSCSLTTPPRPQRRRRPVPSPLR